MAVVKKLTMKVDKWFVVGLYRDENGKVIYKNEVRLSQGFNTREMADIECRVIRQRIDNHVMFVTPALREVKVEIEQRYETGFDYDYKESKIYDAYAEYLRCNEW